MRRTNKAVRGRIAVLFCILMCATQFAQHSEVNPTASQDDRKSHASCRNCGMNRGQFAHSRVLITYADGVETATCSLHCLALDLAINLSKPIRRVQVADYATCNLIDAETAAWVLGGGKAGVMTRRAKWAFATNAAADEFIRTHGGQLSDFTGTLKAAYADMYDFVMFRRQRPTGSP